MANNQSLEINVEKILRKYYKQIVAVFVAFLLVTDTFFTVNPEEVGVITRFGEHIRTVNSGLKAKIPYLESVYKVPVERQKKLEFGFRTEQAGVRTQYSRTGRVGDESLMLTGDLNLASVEWVVQYRIDNPHNYLFKVRNADQTLRAISEATMRQVVGDRTVNEVLTVGRAEIASKVKELMQVTCREYSLGVQIAQVVLQDVNPPEPVKKAFNAVNEAQQEKETLINQAKSAYNKVIPKARGQAEETLQKAEGYATMRVNNAEGEAARFNSVYEEYRRAPEVTKRRMYLETMQEVVPKLGDKIISSGDGNGMIPLLNMQLKKNN